jgi:hypothetical protein
MAMDHIHRYFINFMLNLMSDLSDLTGQTSKYMPDPPTDNFSKLAPA